MVFASYDFIFFFLPITVFTYYLLSRFTRTTRAQHLFLVAASLYFYGYFNPSYLYIIIVSILFNYFCAKCMLYLRCAEGRNREKPKKYMRLPFVAGVLFNILLLGYFKYYDFFISNINAVFHVNFFLKRLLLPLGISFFTFQQLSFLISIYKDTERLGDFIDYALFVTFFPQLVAGPIVLYSEMMPQFADENRRCVNFDHVAQGVYILIWGLFKKIVVADTFAVFADNGFGADELSFSAAWATSLSYTLQIYFDFSGYSDMAIGIGKLFNIDLPVNFNSPYKSKSVSEFWRRWHMTLGRALGTYVYIPLGGNREGLPRTCVNLVLVFIVSGLWHGADWTFVLWGLIYGLLVAFERLFREWLEKIPGILRLIGTFFCVNALWVLFRAADFKNAWIVYRGMMGMGKWGLGSIARLTLDGIVDFPVKIGVAYVLGLLAVAYLAVFTCRNTLERAGEYVRTYLTAASLSMLFALSVIHMSRLSVFIYFNF